MGSKKNRNRRRINAPVSRSDQAETMRPALEQRCRAMGWFPSELNLMRARQAEYQDEVGRAIARAYPDVPQDADANRANKEKRIDLFGAVEHIRRAYARQLRALDAPSPNARNAMIAHTPSRFEAGSDHYSGPVSLPLTDDEEVRRASAAWANVVSWLRPFGVAYRRHMVDVVVHGHPIRDSARLLEALDAVRRHLRGEGKA